MYLHNETYRTYLLFAKMEVGKFLRGHYESGFDENLYMSRENMKNLSTEQQMEMAYFPVSVMVVEENYEITDRHTDVITNTSVRAKRPTRRTSSKGAVQKMSHPTVRSKCIPGKTYNNAIIRLLATKDRFQREGYGAALVAKYLDQRKAEISNVFAITKMNEKYFSVRDKGWRNHQEDHHLTENMSLFYNDYAAPPGWNNYDRVMSVRSDRESESDSEEELEDVPSGTKYPPYVGMNEPYVLMLKKFGFSAQCPHNPSFNNDQDNAIKLNYEGHVMVLKIEKTTSYSHFSKLLVTSSNVSTPGLIYPMYNMSNNHMESLRYMKLNHHYEPSENDELTFDEFFKHGYFESYNHMWHWTIVKRETLENDQSLIGIVKATVVNCEYICYLCVLNLFDMISPTVVF